MNIYTPAIIYTIYQIIKNYTKYRELKKIKINKIINSNKIIL